MRGLEPFVLAAKAACYVGSGERAEPSRIGAKDLCFEQGDWSYRDSYFGGTDFIGQETVWVQTTPVWAMNYYGAVLEPAMIDGQGQPMSSGQHFRRFTRLGGSWADGPSVTGLIFTTT